MVRININIEGSNFINEDRDPTIFEATRVIASADTFFYLMRGYTTSYEYRDLDMTSIFSPSPWGLVPWGAMLQRDT